MSAFPVAPSSADAGAISLPQNGVSRNGARLSLVVLNAVNRRHYASRITHEEFFGKVDRYAAAVEDYRKKTGDHEAKFLPNDYSDTAEHKYLCGFMERFLEGGRKGNTNVYIPERRDYVIERLGLKDESELLQNHRRYKKEQSAGTILEGDYARVASEHLGLVKAIASRIHRRLPRNRADFEELVHIGVLGLMDGVRGYDENRETEPSTYFGPKIRGAILHALGAEDAATRKERKDSKKLERLKRDLAQKLMRNPSSNELFDHITESGAMKLDRPGFERLRLLRQIRDETYSINDRDQDANDRGSLEQTIHDVRATPEGALLATEKRRLLSEALRSIPERKLHVLIQSVLENRSHKEIAADPIIDDVSVARVTELRASACEKVAQSLAQTLGTGTGRAKALMLG